MALLALAIVGASVVWFLLPLDEEPVYRGVKLSEWVVSLGQARAGLAPTEEEREAVLQIGTNALPFLIRWITYPPPWDLRLFGIPLALPRQYTKAELAEGSLVALHVMGPCAAPALPGLVSVMKDTNDVVFHRVMNAIESVVRNLSTNASLVVPPLTQLLDSPNSQVAGIAAIELGNIGKQAQTDAIVATLARATESPDKYLRYCAAFGLGEMGSLARPGVPALVRALNDTDTLVRQTATNSLNKVTPQIPGTKKTRHKI
jgi:hypothetical protein